MRFLCYLLLASLAHAASRPNILLLIGDNWAYEHAAANGCEAVQRSQRLSGVLWLS